MIIACKIVVTVSKLKTKKTRCTRYNNTKRWVYDCMPGVITISNALVDGNNYGFPQIAAECFSISLANSRGSNDVCLLRGIH